MDGPGNYTKVHSGRFRKVQRSAVSTLGLISSWHGFWLRTKVRPRERKRTRRFSPFLHHCHGFLLLSIPLSPRAQLLHCLSILFCCCCFFFFFFFVAFRFHAFCISAVNLPLLFLPFSPLSLFANVFSRLVRFPLSKDCEKSRNSKRKQNMENNFFFYN